jgi:hypothetical protein
MVFLNMSEHLNDDQKHFNALEYDGDMISELTETLFYDITFDSIDFVCQPATDLKRINTPFFNNTPIASVVRDISFRSCFGLENSPPDYDLFEALNSLMNIEKIYLSKVNLSLIPEGTFRQKRLKIFSIFENPYQQFTIGDYAFYECDQLNSVWIVSTNMNYISKNTFNIKNPSQTQLNLYLQENNFDGSSFDSEAFLNTKRPTHIDLSGNKINYIDKSVFSFCLK